MHDDICDQIVHVIHLLEAFKEAIQTFYDQQDSLTTENTTIVDEDSMESTAISERRNSDDSMRGDEETSIATTMMREQLVQRIEYLKQLILQQLGSIHRLQYLQDQFLRVPVYSFGESSDTQHSAHTSHLSLTIEYLNDLIQFLVSLVTRLKRNYTVMEIANMALYSDKKSDDEALAVTSCSTHSSSSSIAISTENLSSSSMTSSSMYNSRLKSSHDSLEEEMDQGRSTPHTPQKKVRFIDEKLREEYTLPEPLIKTFPMSVKDPSENKTVGGDDDKMMEEEEVAMSTDSYDSMV